jgi:thiosulfate/3-mercaptopyruvate sulfurtransferase
MIVTVDSKWLLSHLDDPDIIIIDARGVMPYRFGHIKNALPLDVERIISLADNGAKSLILQQLKNSSVVLGLGLMVLTWL